MLKLNIDHTGLQLTNIRRTPLTPVGRCTPSQHITAYTRQGRSQGVARVAKANRNPL